MTVFCAIHVFCNLFPFCPFEDVHVVGELLKEHRLQWHDSQVSNGPRIEEDGAPFIHLGRRCYECHQGPNRHRAKSEVFLYVQFAKHLL